MHLLPQAAAVAVAADELGAVPDAAPAATASADGKEAGEPAPVLAIEDDSGKLIF